MRINVVTIFPEFFASPLEVSLVGKALEDGTVEVVLHDLRDHGKGAHRQVDDTPYGGGAGMVMMIEPLAGALEPLRESHRVLLTPAGSPLSQETLDRWATLDELTAFLPSCLINISVFPDLLNVSPVTLWKCGDRAMIKRSRSDSSSLSV